MLTFLIDDNYSEDEISHKLNHFLKFKFKACLGVIEVED